MGLQGVRVSVAGLKRVVQELFHDQGTFVGSLLRICESLINDFRLVSRFDRISFSGEHDLHVGAYRWLEFVFDLIA